MAQHPKFPLKCLPSFIFLPKICPQNKPNKSWLFYEELQDISWKGRSIFCPLFFETIICQSEQNGETAWSNWKKITSLGTNLLHKH